MLNDFPLLSYEWKYLFIVTRLFNIAFLLLPEILKVGYNTQDMGVVLATDSVSLERALGLLLNTHQGFRSSYFRRPIFC